MSEGHYLNNQDIVREQPNNSFNVNLLDDMVKHLEVTSRRPASRSPVSTQRFANSCSSSRDKSG